MKTRVLVLSATASAINYKNALSNDNTIELYMTDASHFAAGLYGQNIRPLVIPRSRDLINYKTALENIIARHKIDILIPTSDHDMEGIAKLKLQGWKPDVRMFDFDPEKLLLFTHKSNLMRRLEDLTDATPKTYRNETEFLFPMVIKPAREGGSKGVWIVNSKEDYYEKRSIISRLYGDDVVCQQFIPGDTGSIHVVLLLYGNDGKVYGEAVSRSTLTFMTWGGGGNAGFLVEEPELLKTAKDIIEKLGGWKGPINLEFKKHSGNGRFYLMEINCRLNGYSYLTTMNGLNFPKAVVDLLLNGHCKKLDHEAISTPSNFITTFREKPVDNWINSLNY